jgi:hypothetical protein
VEELAEYLDRWFTPQVFAAIRDGTRAATPQDLDVFLTTLRPAADDYARGTVSIEFIQDQLRS